MYKIFLISICVILFLSPLTSQAIGDENLMGWWKFDSVSQGITPDSSGNGRNGTFVNSCQLVNDPVRGSVLQINSTSNSWVDCGGSGLGGWSDQSTFTVSAWVKISSFQASEQFIVSNGVNYMVGRYGSTDHLRFFTDGYTNVDMVADQLEGHANIQDGKWHLVVFTYNHDTGGRYLYVDAKNDTSAGPQSYKIDFDQNADAFLIGGYVTQPNSCWKGLIDDVRLYNIALTKSQIQMLYGDPYAVNPSPADETGNYNINSILSWQPATTTRAIQGHDVYFGTNFYDVTNGLAAVHKGLQNSSSYNPGKLKSGTSYYWRIDQFDNAGVKHIGYIWSFRTETQGYYMDLFKDSGVNLNGCTEMPSANRMALTSEWIGLNNGDSYGDPVDQAYQDALVKGNSHDDNGVYIYPDRQPRFRQIYVDGGKGAGGHQTSYGPVGIRNIKDFVINGGSYSGSCAGAMCANTFTNWSLSWTGVGSGYKVNYEIPADSRLLSYYDFKGAPKNLEVADVEHWGGPAYSRTKGVWDPNNEVLAYYDPNDSHIYGRELISVIAGKKHSMSGRVIPIGSHPERVPEGKQCDMMAGILAYAFDGNGKPDVKASLQKGALRFMNSNNILGHEKIGDKQYHHFTIQIPPTDHNNIKITLMGDGIHDLNLYAKFGNFAFEGEDGVIEAINDSSSNETIEITNPQSGTWYIGVKGVETVERTLQPWGWEYTGNLDVLNGVPYAIGVDVNFPLQLATMSSEWLEDNWEAIPVTRGNLVGQWNFDNSNANDSSGNGNNGTLIGNAMISTDLEKGKVLDLDGSGDYILVSGYYGIAGSGARTICAWINTTKTGTNYQGIMGWGQNSGGKSWDFVVYNSKLRQMAYNNNRYGSTNVADGQWHHVASVYGGGDLNSVKLYVDGVAETVTGESTAVNTGSSREVRIGDTDSLSGRQFSGMLDDVRIYDYALDDADIQQIYEGTELPDKYQYICTEQPQSDLNGDCLVNFLDFVILSEKWFK